MLAEMLLLGVISEVDHRPYLVSPLNVVEKSNWHPVTAPNRLRLILDQRELNAYLSAPKFRNESLHGARDLFEDDDVMLTYDISAGFFHTAVRPEHREYMGCAGAGAFAGRYFVFSTLRLWEQPRRRTASRAWCGVSPRSGGLSASVW